MSIQEKLAENPCARERNSTSRVLSETFVGTFVIVTTYDILVRRFHTPPIVGEVLGFFEYSINVRKSYITNRECTRREGPRRASHASDYFYLRPFALAGGKRASGPTFGLPSVSLQVHPFSFPPIQPPFFSFLVSHLPVFLVSNQRIGSRLLMPKAYGR